MLDSRERFSVTADLYERYRPAYPAALVDWIVQVAGLAPCDAIADVGCGTGISTRLLATRGFEIVGVDPSEAMLVRARAAGGARYLQGEAVATGLPDASVSLVVAAQAFHWFDIPATLGEFARILRPSGSAAAFWNVRGSSPLLAEYDRLLRDYSVEYSALDMPAQTLAALKARPEARDARETEFGHLQSLDRDGLFGRAYSSSYVVHGVADRQSFDHGLDALFDRHQSEGRVDFHYRTLALWFRIAT